MEPPSPSGELAELGGPHRANGPDSTRKATDYTEAALERVGAEGAVVPCIWSFEVANVLVVAERAGRMQKSKSTEFAQILMDLPIDVEDVNLSSAVGPILDISRQFGLSSYDAQYLELAARKTLDLAVNDRGLRRAAQQAKVALMRNPLSTGIDGQ